MAALQALVACPTGSIGAEDKEGLRAARNAFPVPIDGDVFHCGWHSEKSFGAASYFIQRGSGRNVLIDSPRFSRALVEQLEARGGVDLMLLTHRDDVADHERFADHFGCERVLHADDQSAATADVERLIEGRAKVALDDELALVPTPGHTRGSVCFLWRDTYLFTGDHLAWSDRLGHLYGFRSACWYDWNELVRSTEALRSERFEWVLPGHGRRAHFPADRMPTELETAITWMHTH